MSRVRVAHDTASGCGRRAKASVHTGPLSWFSCGPGALRTAVPMSSFSSALTSSLSCMLCYCAARKLGVQRLLFKSKLVLSPMGIVGTHILFPSWSPGSGARVLSFVPSDLQRVIKAQEGAQLETTGV